MARRPKGLIIGVFCVVACHIGRSQTQPPELWYWHHSYLSNPSALQSSKALIDQAYAAGYTGVAFWDVSFEFLNSPTWPPSATSYLQQAMNYAISKGMKVMADGAPYGWSNDVLKTNPNWAEGQRISGARFQVNGSATQLQLVNSFPGLVNGGFESGKTAWFKIGDAGVDVDATVSHSGSLSGVIRNAPANGRFAQLLPVTPWRQYHLRMYVKTQNYGGSTPWFMVWDVSNSAKQRLYNNINIAATQDWTQVDATFNSQDSTQAWLYFGEWGGSTGAIWFDDVSVEETALVNVLRRPGTPLKIYDPNTAAAFQEGKDYNFISDPQLGPYPKDDYHTPPAVTLPAGTTLAPGQTVAMDFYAVQPIYSAETGMCLTEAGAQNWLIQNAQAVTAAVPASAGYFLGYDEMRHMNSCASCKAKGLTPGQLLAWHAGQTINLYQSLRPSAPIYVWSDMFDPYHNAHDNYYLVEGDIAGSWLGIPSKVTIMNWNLGDLKNSLTWFSGKNSQQPVAYRQIIAGYYDSGDGAGAAATELQQALGIPGIAGLMYTTWLDDYSQLKPFADAVKNNWASYQASVNPPVLSVSKSHSGSFTQGQQNATYTVTVSNGANAGPSSGTVAVTETVPSGLTLISMNGTGWACSNTCLRSDALSPGGSYPPITVTVNVAANATSPQVNMVSVSGGGSAAANASDTTNIVAPASAAMTSPANGSTLAGSSVNFQWTTGTGVTQFWFTLSKVGAGGAELFNADPGPGLVTSKTITGLPTDGSTIYVSLYSHIGSAWIPTYYSYTAAGPATITSPMNGSMLPGSSVTFQWTTGTGVTQYWFTLSKVGAGGAELFNADPGPGLVTSKTINGLPTDGSTIYVSLYSHIGSAWIPTNYTYTAAGPATITSPVNGSTLPGSSVTFQWTTGIGVTQYWFTLSKVGVGGAELFNADPGPGLVTSKTINGLPTDGSSIYVSLYSHIGSAWTARYYTYTAFH